MSSIDFNKLIHAATYYLSYQQYIGRNFMIDESSLKYPIADYLTSLEISLSNIQLEYLHPTLKNRNIDLITTDITKEKIENAFEFKISKQATRYESEQKRIFNDLMRLFLMNKSKNAACYFLIAGTQIDFIQHFRSISNNRPRANNNDLPSPEGFYTEWFKFKVSDVQTFRVKESTENLYKDIYDAFLSDYYPKDEEITLQLPESITTKCIAISALSRDFPTPYVGGIWLVE